MQKQLYHTEKTKVNSARKALQINGEDVSKSAALECARYINLRMEQGKFNDDVVLKSALRNVCDYALSYADGQLKWCEKENEKEKPFIDKEAILNDFMKKSYL